VTKKSAVSICNRDEKSWESIQETKTQDVCPEKPPDRPQHYITSIKTSTIIAIPTHENVRKI
jgi:hypothetical protein